MSAPIFPNLPVVGPTCGTCRHWGAPRPEDYEEVTPAIKADSERLGMWDKIRPCGAVYSSESDGVHCFVSPPRDRKAVVCDGSGYYASLRTAADFGCTMWEPKA